MICSMSVCLSVCVYVCQRCDIISGDLQLTDSDCQWSSDESDTEVYALHFNFSLLLMFAFIVRTAAV